MPRRALIGAALCAALIAGALTACTPSGGSATAPPDTATEHARFGAPANPDGHTLELQSDVVVVGGGKNAVWGASSDGTTWTLDSNAPGMDRLAIDRVLLARPATRPAGSCRSRSTAIAPTSCSRRSRSPI
ncbi:MAG: hypothetical protein JST33_15400 [Actinobacteria bacterium]|nr:hypothetical protein [Actinomycetota bacterium]